MITAPATTPAELPGLDPRWSRIVSIPGADGSPIGVHLLDHGPRDAALTVVCVHGNPTWSYLWREVIAQAPSDVRVVALDHVGMGYSARLPGIRRLEQRIDDLDAVIDQLDIRGKVALIAHDWGGPITLGWAERAVSSARYQDRIARIVLTNTAVHQADDQSAPRLILAARVRWLRHLVTADTTTFLRGTTAISTVDRAHARAFRAPYRSRDRREAISDFVADIPFETDHPSQPTLRAIAEGLADLSSVPILLVWGMNDPVFAPRYLDDLRARLPHADVQQLSDAGHLVLEDRPDAINDIWQWITREQDEPTIERTDEPCPSPVAKLNRLAATKNQACAISEPVANRWRDVSWALLNDRVGKLAAEFQRRGIKAGQRVGVLVPPGADLIAAVYALWSMGATVVVIDAAHRPPAMVRALRGARLQHAVAIRRAAPIVLALRLPGVVVWRDQLADALRNGAAATDTPAGSIKDPDSDAVIVFTSGATGTAKPVAYSWARLAATAQVLQSQYEFTSDDVLIAAFAPWAVMGPLLGLASVIPEMDASRPGTLTASALADASAHAGGTVMWASPAAMRSVLASAPPESADREHLAQGTSRLRLLMIAGAPVPRDLLGDIVDCWPSVDVRTPYGMTEVLPATDISAQEVLGAAPSGGVLVGRPLPGVQIRIAALDSNGVPSSELSEQPGVLGEIAIRASHAKSRYDGLAFEEHRASKNRGWHRSGDVGRLDEHGRLWVDGRLSHVITTPGGPVGSVTCEQRIAEQLQARGADYQGLSLAAVGVGPQGCQVPVIVAAPGLPAVKGHGHSVRLAPPDLTELIREIDPTIAAVLWTDRLPVDIRHGAKVDRALLAAQASALLAGRQ